MYAHFCFVCLILKVLDNWRKRFQEIPRYPSPGEDYEEVRTCVEIALQCMADDRLTRPSMNHIVSNLNQREMMSADSKLMRLLKNIGKPQACILPKRKDLKDESGLPIDLQEMPSLGWCYI